MSEPNRCSCGQVALRRVGSLLYCKTHAEEAEDRLKAEQSRFDEPHPPAPEKWWNWGLDRRADRVA